MMRTSRVSPGAAPSTQIGPVRMWGPNWRPPASMIRRCPARTPASPGGRSARPPETLSSVTRSPERTLSTGSRLASQYPQCTVSGVTSRL